MRHKAWSVFGLALLFGGCISDSGGQSGDFSGDDDEGEPASGQCEDTETPVELDDDSALGFSANDVLEVVARDFESPLVWQSLEAVQYGPESGASTLTLSVTPSGEAWYVTSKPRDSGREDGPAIGVLCPEPRLHVGAEVSVQSAGGALAEAFTTKISASTKSLASFQHSLDLEALSGSFAVQSTTPPEGEVKQATLAATLSPAGMAGSFSALLEVQDAQVSSATGLVFALWPGTSECTSEQPGVSGIPLEIGEQALGITGEEALDILNGTVPAELQWQDGSTTELTLTATASGGGCLFMNPQSYSGEPDVTAKYAVTLVAVSEDGRLDGRYVAEVTVAGEDDAQTVTVEVSLPLELDQLASTGLEEVTLPEGLHRLFFSLSSEVEGGVQRGNLTLNGLTDPPCVTDPPEPDPNSNSAPGCEGTHVTELESATWVTIPATP